VSSSSILRVEAHGEVIRPLGFAPSLVAPDVSARMVSMTAARE
jgi:hypothetical protein